MTATRPATAVLGLALAACACAGDASGTLPDAGVIPDARAEPPPPPPPGAPDAGATSSPWRLVWNDEFDGSAGKLPDASKWNLEVGGHGWGNNELQYHTSRASNASLDGAGNLTIVARREAFGGRDYTSARLTTAGRFEHAYGRFEARIQLPTGRGIWPAFWMLGNDLSQVGWPDCGEIDIMEHRGHEPRVIYGSLHGPGYAAGDSLTGAHVADSGLPDAFHVYAVEWLPGRVTWLIDGEVYYERSSNSIPDWGRWVYDHPFFLILNVAVGGDFLGPPDGSTSFPQSMRVDYVRGYERVP